MYYCCYASGTPEVRKNPILNIRVSDQGRSRLKGVVLAERKPQRKLTFRGSDSKGPLELMEGAEIASFSGTGNLSRPRPTHASGRSASSWIDHDLYAGRS
ncbi:hypothetical protein NL676_010348 [Syzygium grande]|nr:hypothetical protein NL676_010348 [Syzygium grande]